MAFDSSYPAIPALAFSMQWRGRRRVFAPSRWVSVALLVGLPLLAAWYLCASLYLVFHDQLLASLIARQTDMQYSYEDRIAALRTELDRASSRGMIDRNTLETTIRDLAARGAKLEARAAAIDALVPAAGARGNPLLTPAAPALPADASAYAPSSLEPATSFRSLDSSALDKGDGGLASTGAPERRLDALAAALTQIETRQARAVDRLREPMSRSIERMQAALADADIPVERWQAAPRGDVGGPFVPLPPDAAASLDTGGFDATVALLRDTAAEEARLKKVIDRVPLRRPLEGPLEVTSTFGARIDPFYGRPAMHTGIDLHENYGDAVEATAAGVVTVAGAEGGYGNMVEVDHGNGLTTRYAHLSSIEVAVHQRVAVGEIVGRVGATGRATGPHLHYETRINGEPVNPARFLRAGSVLFPG